MKILYDHQIFSRQKYGGISRYFCELYTHFLTMNTIYPEISVLYSENTYYNKIFHKRQILPEMHFLGKTTIINKINECYCKNQIRHGKFDIFHPTYYNPYFLKTFKTRPYVLTVYDMIHELFPDMFKRDNIAKQKKEVIESATKIISISENTKIDIIKLYDIDPEKIEVIPLATSLQLPILDISPNIPKRYILFVGNREYYKNFSFFIKSISSILDEEKDLYLICAGGGVFSDDDMRLFDEFKIKKKVLYYPITNDSMLSLLYQKAILFVFPSIYEGFGIPVLEAFSCGCPVAASNTSSLPEVGGDAVNYFDPNNSDSIHNVIENIVNENSLQESLRIRGYQRLKLFSWEKTALNTKKVYDNLLNQ